ncbi:MAG: hypothetical protein M1399_05040 [Actinobacteria bacterium]|nr:hypothetical protein [Actinomycetota bacterium]MCL5447201.1 hypothetical protein [Actinomycetota bacterium]
MLKRARWFIWGALVGAVGAVVGRHRVLARLHDISEPDGQSTPVARTLNMAAWGAKRVGRGVDLTASKTSGLFRSAISAGRDEARRKEAEIWEEISNHRNGLRSDG